jgi:hypothetical protein
LLSVWFQVVLVALVIGVAVFLLPRAAANLGVVFALRVTRDGARLRGRVPGHSAATVCQFVDALGLPPGARIVARRDGSRFRLEFSPDVPAEAHQQLRNFLYLHL